MKHFRRIYVLLLFALFLGGGVVLVVKDQQDYAKIENRYLEKMPSFSVDAYLKGDFQKQMEKAVTDQFPNRDLFTGESTVIRKIMGLHDVGDIYLGKDDYYLDKKLEKDMPFSQYKKNLATVKLFADTYGRDATFHVMLVPSPATILSDRLPAFAKIYDADRYEQMAQAMFGESWIDIRKTLSEAGNEEKQLSSILYFRTDHHWTHSGAYVGYRAFEEAMGRTPKDPAAFQYKKVSEDFYGTMFSRALDWGATPDTIEIPTVSESIVVKKGEEEIPLYDLDKLKEKDQYAVYFGGNYPSVTIQNPQAENPDKRLLVFKDSFANSLIPLLTDEYGEIEMIDLRYETRTMKRILEEGKPDDILVLYEMSNFATGGEVGRMGL